MEAGMITIQLLTELASLEEAIKSERPNVVSLSAAEVRLDYRVDPETGDAYAMLDVCLPDGWLAEVDEDTFGQLTGVRFYLDDE